MGGTSDDRLPVVPSKIDRPREPTRAIGRARLIAQLADGAGRLAVVTAPGGYGKTTLLRQWADRWPGAVAWVTADPADDDPLVFVRAVVEAIGASHPVGEVRHLLQRRPVPLHDEVLPCLAVAIGQTPTPLLVVVDDAHEITSDATLEVLDLLADAIPERSRLVISGRRDRVRRLGRRKLSEEVVELGADDLRFTAEESAAVVDRSHRPDLSEPVVGELHRLTEGWPAALHLSLLSLAGKPDPQGAVSALGHRSGDLVRYIEQELLSSVGEDDGRFLLHTCVLERLNGPLCDATTGEGGGAQRLERLVAAGNPFVVPLEGGDEYRYHPLFADFLLARLRRAEPRVEPELRRRAAEWLLADGDPEGAVRQALASNDLDVATDVVYRLVFPMMERGDDAALERWLERFPSGEVLRRPPLLVAQTWVALNRGRAGEVDDLLGLLDAADLAAPLPDGTVSLEVATAMLRVVGGRDGVKAMAAWAQVVIDAGPSGSPWWGTAVMQHAVAVHLAGSGDDPVELFDRAERATRGSGAVHAITLAHCGLVRLQRDDPEGYELVDRAVDTLERAGASSLPLAVMVLTVLAYAAARRGHREASIEAAAQASARIDQVRDAIPRGEAHHRLILADAALVRNDLPGAARELALAQVVLPGEPEAQLLHDWAERIARRTSARRQADDETSWSQLSAAELRVLEQLRTHRSLEEIGTHLYISRNTVKSHTIAIYRKLGVSGRSAAVDRAIELGLLPG